MMPPRSAPVYQVDWLELIGKTVELDFWVRSKTDERLARCAGVLELVEWQEYGRGYTLPTLFRFRSPTGTHIVLAPEHVSAAFVSVRVQP